MGASASPHLIAACYVLHRLSTPRHPSEALQRLIVSQQNSCMVVYRPASREAERHHACALYLSDNDVFSGPSSKRGVRAGGTLHSRCQSQIPKRELQTGSSSIARFGGARRDRTDDLMLAKHALYQLSYGPIGFDTRWPRRMVEIGRPGQTRTADLTLIRRTL